ncbi:MAG: hypothetical protein ACLFVQ_09545 [Chitinispirillaceae bacterium]
MTAVIVGLVILMILVLVAVKTSFTKEEESEELSSQIHQSGIWSVIRKSPRESLIKVRPKEEEIRKYLADLDENKGKLARVPDPNRLVEHWKAQLDANIQEIESGDRLGVEFYYYDFPQECPGCESLISKGQFVSREEIFQHPQIIPPFHLGCSCRIVAHHGNENLRETTESGLRPFFAEGEIPPLPEWTTISTPQTSEVQS